MVFKTALYSLLLFSFPLVAQNLYPDQFWLITSFKTNFHENTFSAGYEGRWEGDDIYLNLYYAYWMIPVSKRSKISFAYKDAHFLRDSGWTKYHIPYINWFYTVPFQPFAFTLRTRFEYWIADNIEPFTRYRPKATLKYHSPVKNITPYVDSEWFVDLNGRGLRFHRLYIGNAAVIQERLSLKVFYCLYTALENPNWTNQNVVGTTFTVLF